MNTQYIYHEEGNKVVEKARPEPDTWDYCPNDYDFDKETYDRHMDIWKQHIASLKEYTCHESCKLKEGQVLEEGKDFEIKKCDCKIGTDCVLHYGQWFSPCKIAYPLPQVTESEEEFQNKAGYSMNFEIGSSHWVRTLMANVSGIGEYMVMHKDEKLKHQEEWGNKLKNIASDLVKWHEKQRFTIKRKTTNQ